MQVTPRVSRCELAGRPKRSQQRREPVAGVHVRPPRVESGRAVAEASRHAGARDQPHRFRERQPALGGDPLRLLEPFHRSPQLVGVDLDPLAANEGEAARAGEDLAHLGRGQRRAVEGERHAEIEERIDAEAGGFARSDGGGDLWAWRTRRAPARGHAHNDAGAFEGRGIGEKPVGVGRRPAQRVKDFARVHHLAQPGALCGGALHRQEQRQEPVAIPRAGILAHGIAQRQVLGLAERRELVRVRGEERKGREGIRAVFSEIEVDAPNHVPGRIELLEQLLGGGSGAGLSRGEGRVHLEPECLEHVRTHVFGAGHGRCAEGERFEVGGVGGRYGRVPGIGAGPSTEGRDVANAQLPPVTERGGQGLADLGAAKLEQSLSRAAREGVEQAFGEGRVELRRVVAGSDGEATVWREGRGEANVRHGMAMLGAVALPRKAL